MSYPPIIETPNYNTLMIPENLFLVAKLLSDFKCTFLVTLFIYFSNFFVCFVEIIFVKNIDILFIFLYSYNFGQLLASNSKHKVVFFKA